MLSRGSAIAARSLSKRTSWARLLATSSKPRPIRGEQPVRRPQTHVIPTADHDPNRGIISADLFAAGKLSSKQSAVFLRTRLVTALHPPSSSSSSRTPSVPAILDAVKPLITDPKLNYILVSYVHEIAMNMSPYYIAHPPETDDIPLISQILAHCCLSPRLVNIQRARVKNLSHALIASWYADYLLAEAFKVPLDQGRLALVLDSFETNLGAIQKEVAAKGGEFRLVVMFTAAWAILRARAGRTGGVEDFKITLPHSSTVLGQLTKMGVEVDDTLRDVTISMCDSLDQARLPTSIDALHSRLASLRSAGKVSAIAQIWNLYRDEFDLGAASKHPLVIADDNGTVKYHMLAKFLATAHSRVGTYPSTSESDRATLVDIGKQVLARVPPQTPLPILHTQLQTATLPPKHHHEDDSGASSDAQDYGRVPTPAAVARDKSAVLERVAEIWDAARAAGVVRDPKAYSIYLGVLGKYHDYQGLLTVWNELVADKACRALYEAEIGTAAPSWPPTAMLNHALSLGLLIGSHASSFALDLYRQAIDPSTPIVPDLVTINTALRHAAHRADIPFMNDVIATAGRLGLQPDIVTYTTLVQGLLRADEPEMARKTLDAMRQRGIEPNDRMAAMLVADLASGGTREGLIRAEDVVRDMRQRGIKTSVPMWTSLIAGYFCGGWEQDGWSALDRMRKSDLKLNVVGYNVVLRQAIVGRPGTTPNNRRAAGEMSSTPGLSSSSSLTFALFEQMVSENVSPNVDTYTIVLGGLLAAQSFDEAERVVKDMERRGFKAHNRSLTSMVRTVRARRGRHPRVGDGGDGGSVQLRGDHHGRR